MSGLLWDKHLSFQSLLNVTASKFTGALDVERGYEMSLVFT